MVRLLFSIYHFAFFTIKNIHIMPVSKVWAFDRTFKITHVLFQQVIFLA